VVLSFQAIACAMSVGLAPAVAVTLIVMPPLAALPSVACLKLFDGSSTLMGHAASVALPG